MNSELDANEWVWQGFFGPTAAAVAAKAIVDKDARAGVWIPIQDAPPMYVDVGGVMSMFAVQTRAGDQIPTPTGMWEADPSMVGRMVGG